MEFQTPPNENKIMVLEYLDGGNLYQQLHEKKIKYLLCNKCNYQLTLLVD